MSLMVRKIEYGKWVQRDIIAGEQPSADAITNCMRTSSNTLSLWSINDENELEEAVIAIASQFDHLTAIDILSIDPRLIEQRGLPIKESPGITPYEGFADRHVDVASLDYDSLGLMAGVIVESLRQNRRKRFTLGKLKALLASAITSGKIQKSDLKPSVQNKIP